MANLTMLDAAKITQGWTPGIFLFKLIFSVDISRLLTSPPNRSLLGLGFTF